MPVSRDVQILRQTRCHTHPETPGRRPATGDWRTGRWSSLGRSSAGTIIIASTSIGELWFNYKLAVMGPRVQRYVRMIRTMLGSDGHVVLFAEQGPT